MKVFLDTNIVMDYLADREPFSYNASVIIQLALDGEFHLCASALTEVTCSFLLGRGRNKMEKSDIYSSLQFVKDNVELLDLEVANEIEHALALKADDFEDAVQFYSAKKAEADCIVTRNVQDFPFADIPVLTPEQFLTSVGVSFNSEG